MVRRRVLRVSWSPDGMALMIGLREVGLKMAPLVICENCGVVQVRPLERNCWSNHGHCFECEFVFAMLEPIYGHYDIDKLSHDSLELLVELK